MASEGDGPITRDNDIREYLASHHVPQMMEGLMSSLMVEMPDEPFKFLDHKLDAIREVGIDNVNWEKFVYMKHPSRDPHKNKFCKSAEPLVSHDPKSRPSSGIPPYKPEVFKLTEAEETEESPSAGQTTQTPSRSETVSSLPPASPVQEVDESEFEPRDTITQATQELAQDEQEITLPTSNQDTEELVYEVDAPEDRFDIDLLGTDEEDAFPLLKTVQIPGHTEEIEETTEQLQSQEKESEQAMNEEVDLTKAEENGENTEEQEDLADRIEQYVDNMIKDSLQSGEVQEEIVKSGRDSIRDEGENGHLQEIGSSQEKDVQDSAGERGFVIRPVSAPQGHDSELPRAVLSNVDDTPDNQEQEDIMDMESDHESEGAAVVSDIED